MDRILEPELMEDHEQVEAYATADFSEPHNHFIQCVAHFIGSNYTGNALDLGCGPGDITCRFARQYPECRIDAVDGSKAMLEYGTKSLSASLAQQISFIHSKIPFTSPLPMPYGVIFSNSLLHHLPDPQTLWQTIKACSGPETSVVVMDLLRAKSESDATLMVKHYAANEPEVLKNDFYHSLLAAFTLDEIQSQLTAAQLNLNVEQISDRHVLITGKINTNK